MPQYDNFLKQNPSDCQSVNLEKTNFYLKTFMTNFVHKSFDDGINDAK